MAGIIQEPTSMDTNQSKFYQGIQKNAFCQFSCYGFITAILVNPTERKLTKRTSVHCNAHTTHLTIIVKEIFACCYRAMCSNMFEVAIELFQSQNVLNLSSCLLQVL